MFGVVGTIGDQITWGVNFGFFMDMIGISMLVNAIYGAPPNGIYLADIYFTIYGIQLVMKNLMLGVGGLYVIIIRIAKFFCYKDVDYTPVWEAAAHRGPHGGNSTHKLNPHSQVEL